jgi:hypothetical protein
MGDATSKETAQKMRKTEWSNTVSMGEALEQTLEDAIKTMNTESLSLTYKDHCGTIIFSEAFPYVLGGTRCAS